MSLISGAEKTCAWCVVAAIAALTLLAVTWTVILVNSAGALSTIKTCFLVNRVNALTAVH